MGEILDKGGNSLQIALLTSANAVLTSYTLGTNCLALDPIKNSTAKIDPSIEKFKAEDGKTYGSDETYEGNTEGIIMKTPKLIVDYLAFTVRDAANHLEIKYQGIKYGKHQEIFKLADVIPQMNLTSPGQSSSMKYESTSVVPATATTFTAGDLTLIETATGKAIYAPGPVVIPAGQEYVMVETAVS